MHTIIRLSSSTWALDTIVIGQDDSDTYIRKVRLHLSVGLTELCKDPEIAEWLYSQTNGIEYNEISFEDLFTEFPEAKDVIENTEDPLSQLTDYTYEQLEGILTYRGYDYRPSIFLVNPTSANGTYKPVVSTAFEVEDDEVNNIDDVAFAWHLSNTNEVSQIKIWKDLALTVSAPVFSVTLQDKNPPAASQAPTDWTQEGNAPSDAINFRLHFTKLNIKKRYENIGKSEVRIASKYFYTPNGWPTPAQAITFHLRDGCYSGTTYGDKLITKVHKNDVNTVLNLDDYFCRLDATYELTQNKHIYSNLYEYDNMESNKDLGTVEWPWGNPKAKLILKGQMAYADEWYLWNPKDNFYVTRMNQVGIYDGLYTVVSNPSGNLRSRDIENIKLFIRLECVSPCY